MILDTPRGDGKTKSRESAVEGSEEERVLCEKVRELSSKHLKSHPFRGMSIKVKALESLQVFSFTQL